MVVANAGVPAPDEIVGSVLGGQVRLPWRLVWCFERCWKDENAERRHELETSAVQLGASMVCFKKARSFERWIEGMRSPFFTLVTDWREAQPSIQAIMNQERRCNLVQTVVICDTARQVGRANTWAKGLPASLGHVTILLNQDVKAGEVADQLDKCFGHQRLPQELVQQKMQELGYGVPVDQRGEMEGGGKEDGKKIGKGKEQEDVDDENQSTQDSLTRAEDEPDFDDEGYAHVLAALQAKARAPNVTDLPQPCLSLKNKTSKLQSVRCDPPAVAPKDKKAAPMMDAAVTQPRASGNIYAQAATSMHSPAMETPDECYPTVELARRQVSGQHGFHQQQKRTQEQWGPCGAPGLDPQRVPQQNRFQQQAPISLRPPPGLELPHAIPQQQVSRISLQKLQQQQQQQHQQQQQQLLQQQLWETQQQALMYQRQLSEEQCRQYHHNHYEHGLPMMHGQGSMTRQGSWGEVAEDEEQYLIQL
jgi:hypothetical protein